MKILKKNIDGTKIDQNSDLLGKTPKHDRRDNNKHIKVILLEKLIHMYDIMCGIW